MIAAFAGAVALAGCAHVMGQRPQEEAKAPVVQSAQSVQPAPAAPAKVKPRQVPPAKAPTPTKSR
ncbi:MAG TPA: hypothetical protein V6D00_10945, partial [Pantanalinema sp.]